MNYGAIGAYHGLAGESDIPFGCVFVMRLELFPVELVLGSTLR